jgi:pimeloyl-ACP methyl ester carboxylesterase
MAWGRRALLVLCSAVAVAVFPAVASAGAPVFRPGLCPPGVFDATVDVQCGSMTVPERRSRPDGRTITVAAAVVHAPSSPPKRDPIVFLDGGPSFGAISPFALGSYFSGAAFAENRDIVLVDTRGTGFARPRLGCPEFDRADVSSFYSKPFVGSSYVRDFSDAVVACHTRLSATGTDLSAYNSAESAADLNDLRRALGYRRWNLLAISADGVLGLTYMRLYPKGIRSAIIDSGQSVQHLGELDYLRGLTQELERVFAGCAANPACNATYPGIRTVFFSLVDDLQEHPRVIALPDFTPQPVKLRVAGVDFYLDALFELFPGDRFAPETIHSLLSEIWRSAHGQLDAVYRERLGTGPVTNNTDTFFAQGKTMSYVCRDIVGFITRDDLSNAARDIPALGPYFRDPNFGLPVGPTGCRIRSVGVADPAQHQPVRSRIPTLVLAGEYDGGVPPLIVRQIPPTLPNSFFYEFPAGAHLQLADYNVASPCARSIAGQFLDRPRRRPDATCLASVAPFDFTPPHALAAPAPTPSPWSWVPSASWQLTQTRHVVGP